MSDQLTSILQRAEQRRAALGKDAEFLTVLLQQVQADLQLSGVALWQWTTEDVQRIAAVGDIPAQPPDITELQKIPIGEPAAVEAPCGTLRVLWVSTMLAQDAGLAVQFHEQGLPVDGTLSILLTDVFADLQRRRLVDHVATDRLLQTRLLRLVKDLHEADSADEIASVLATDGAAVLGCRQMTVLQRGATGWRVQASTGVVTADARSDAARQAVRQVTATAAGETDAVPADSLVLPLSTPEDWTSTDRALVVSGSLSPSQMSVVQSLQQHACVAFHRHSLSSSWWTASNGHSNWRLRWLAGLLVPGLFLAWLLLTSQPLFIEVYGAVQPRKRTFVFAPDDGTVTRLQARDGKRVSVGDVLCELTNEDLNLQLESVEGQLAAANARLAALASLRNTGGRSAELRLLSAEQAELTAQVESLKSQQQILTDRLDQLTLKAVQQGVVYGERLQQVLSGRPVQRGQFLFEIASPQSGWELELQVPEADARYVLLAMQGDTPPQVTYSLETSPETVRFTTLTSLGLAVRPGKQGQLVTPAGADVRQDDSLGKQRPGAGVVARIHCGEHRTGFVWFRQLIEMLQRETWL